MAYSYDRTAGEGDSDKMRKAFLDWIEDVIQKAQAAKTEVSKNDSPGRAASSFVGTVAHYRDEGWYDYFYR